MTAAAQTVRIVFAGGGTGGHLFPAIAIADRIRELLQGRTPVEIRFVGTTRGIEYRMRDRLGYPLEIINVRGLVRSFTLTNLIVPFVLIGALIRAWLMLGRFKPDVVVGTGGYVALPILKTAVWRKIPTVLQEQNSFPGITTRQAAGSARRIYLGFEGARQHLKTKAEIILTGNPVRRTIADADRNKALAEYNLDPSRKTILVLGGSQGARAINNAVMKSLQTGGVPEGYQILWQTGKRDYTEVAAQADGQVKDCTLFPFAHDMAAVYAAADLAIARAGALTLAELTACAVPSVLVPYPAAAGDHQRKNAADMAARGAATVIDENDLGEHDLLQEAAALAGSTQYGAMKTALVKMNEGKKPAVDIIANDIIELIEAERKRH
ncbi:MAG: undecaprenyldiphospho-muramoylpentapeptide beta-N-acetylglucosaminyltransferase [Bacteroidetes bacterium]|nr:undecaprenyldiphospho-muramoylpentapeptide beta-N-acetylglucosaminyltransferase [Bacteroidota bacterium]